MRKKTNHPSYQTEAGVTLVEILIAAAILATGLLAVSTMISRSTIQDSRAYHMTHASMIIEEFLENATRLQYNSDDYSTLSDINSAKTVRGVIYNMNCTISAFAPVDRCKEMTCTVNWNNKGIQASTQYVYVFSPKY